MATKIKPELSSRSKYWIEKHRYYELKHYCLQYPQWKREYNDITGLIKAHSQPMIFFTSNEVSNPVPKLVEDRLKYFEKIDLLDQIAEKTDPIIGKYILRAVTEDRSYNYFKATYDIPCGRDMYYDRYRRFFWLLDKARN